MPFTVVRPAEPEPVRLGQVALGDADEAGQARLRGEQIVERSVEPPGVGPIGEPVADRPARRGWHRAGTSKLI